MHRSQVVGKPRNLEEETAIRTRLKEIREYIREEQRFYLEAFKRKPDSEKETMEEILKRLF